MNQWNRRDGVGGFVWEVTNPADDKTVGTLRYVLEHATEFGDMIVIGEDVYHIELESVLLLTKRLHIVGPCILARKDGAGGGIISVTSSGDVTLSHITISPGDRDSGVAISNDGRLALTRCRLLGNRAMRGGEGSVRNHGTMAMEGCTIAWNAGDLSGGGIFNSGSLTFSGCVLQENVVRIGDDSGATPIMLSKSGDADDFPSRATLYIPLSETRTRRKFRVI